MMLPAQAAAAIGSFAILAAWPPASGRMLLIPLSSGEASVARPAIAAGAVLLGTGPVAGSLIVVGRRSRIVAATASRGILVLAAPPAGCGAGVEENAA